MIDQAKLGSLKELRIASESMSKCHLRDDRNCAPSSTPVLRYPTHSAVQQPECREHVASVPPEVLLIHCSNLAARSSHVALAQQLGFGMHSCTRCPAYHTVARARLTRSISGIGIKNHKRPHARRVPEPADADSLRTMNDDAGTPE